MGIDKRVGGQIKKLRKQAGLTQEFLAEKSGLSSDFLSRLERGGCSVSLKSLEMIADALQVPIKRLFSFEAASAKILLNELTELELDDEQQQAFKSLFILLRRKDAKIIEKVYRQAQILLEE